MIRKWDEVFYDRRNKSLKGMVKVNDVGDHQEFSEDNDWWKINKYVDGQAVEGQYADADKSRHGGCNKNEEKNIAGFVIERKEKRTDSDYPGEAAN